MTDEEIVATLRLDGRGLSPVKVAELLGSLTSGGLSQGAIVTYFKRAFPAIPLRVLLDAGAWNRVSDGGMSDEEFNELLKPWLAA